MTSPSSDRVELAVTADVASVLRFYERVGHGRAVAENDRVLVVRSGGEVVAAVRLCDESSTLVLRGMYLSEKRQRQGLGTRLLALASSEIGSAECWCVPYAHLVEFYSQIGFSEANKTSTPTFLKERCSTYEKNGARVTIMRRPGSWSVP